MIIIDDMDMINQQNQQVFCNYIDKYKENVCFVFVCLNVQKIIENIQSRIVLLKIEPPTLNQLSNFMDKIILQETMNIEDDVKQYILSISNYSIRSLINNLEKVNIYTMDDKLNPNARISLDICKKLCSNISLNWFEDYISFLRNQNLNDAIKILYEINDYGYSVIDILDYFFSFVKMTDLLDEDEKYNIIHILCKYITIFHNVHEDVIELSLLTNDIYRKINALRITNGMCQR
jgi:DNA polymerase III delta prime subunit